MDMRVYAIDCTHWISGDSLAFVFSQRLLLLLIQISIELLQVAPAIESDSNTLLHGDGGVGRCT
jgi:hypothetical protein